MSIIQSTGLVKLPTASSSSLALSTPSNPCL